MCGGVFDLFHVAFAGVLGDEDCAGDGKAGAERDHEKDDRKAERNGGNSAGTKAANPKGIDELIGGVKKISEDNGDGEGY